MWSWKKNTLDTQKVLGNSAVWQAGYYKAISFGRSQFYA